MQRLGVPPRWIASFNLAKVGSRPPGGCVCQSQLHGHTRTTLRFLVPVGYRRRNRPAVGCLPIVKLAIALDTGAKLYRRPITPLGGVVVGCRCCCCTEAGCPGAATKRSMSRSNVGICDDRSIPRSFDVRAFVILLIKYR